MGARYVIYCAGVDVCTLEAQNIYLGHANLGLTITLVGNCTLAFQATIGNIAIREGTYIEAKNGSLSFNAKADVDLAKNAAVISRSVNLVAANSLNVSGLVDVSGSSSNVNTDAAYEAGRGWGGSYGGSGGRACGDEGNIVAPYSNVHDEVGSADIFAELNTHGLVAIQGKAGMSTQEKGIAGGKGGGVAILQGVVVTIEGTVDARGDPGMYDYSGCGSGGDIGIATSF